MAQAMRAIAAADPVPKGSLAKLLDHFDHALRVAGEDHVGLGSDFDGVPSMPAELEEVSDLPNLTRGLLERGWSEAVVRKVLGENLLRMMREVEQRARPAQPRIRSTPEPVMRPCFSASSARLASATRELGRCAGGSMRARRARAARGRPRACSR